MLPFGWQPFSSGIASQFFRRNASFFLFIASFQFLFQGVRFSEDARGGGRPANRPDNGGAKNKRAQQYAAKGKGGKGVGTMKAGATLMRGGAKKAWTNVGKWVGVGVRSRSKEQKYEYLLR